MSSDLRRKRVGNLNASAQFRFAYGKMDFVFPVFRCLEGGTVIPELSANRYRTSVPAYTKCLSAPCDVIQWGWVTWQAWLRSNAKSELFSPLEFRSAIHVNSMQMLSDLT